MNSSLLMKNHSNKQCFLQIGATVGSKQH